MKFNDVELFDREDRTKLIIIPNCIKERLSLHFYLPKRGKVLNLFKKELCNYYTTDGYDDIEYKIDEKAQYVSSLSDNDIYYIVHDYLNDELTYDLDIYNFENFSSTFIYTPLCRERLVDKLGVSSFTDKDFNFWHDYLRDHYNQAVIGIKDAYMSAKDLRK